MPYTIRASLIATVLLITPQVLADENHSHDHGDETRELGAHQHGHAVLQVALEGNMVEMAFEVPGESIVGFEHAPETDEQRTAVDEASTQLSDPLALFTVPTEAGCEVSSSAVELHQEGDHSAFEAEYALTCSNADAITTLETTLFELYPDLEEIEVEYATPSGQGAGELEPGAASLTLPSTS